jgi:hypothetical protein
MEETEAQPKGTIVFHYTPHVTNLFQSVYLNDVLFFFFLCSGGKKGGDEDEDDADLKKLRAGLTGMIERKRLLSFILYTVNEP